MVVGVSWSGAAGTGELQFIEGTMNANIYCDILKQSMIPSLRRLDRRAVFQHDNDPKHTSKTTTAWLKKLRVKVMDWPSMSPDLNPIEHLWGVLKRKVFNFHQLRDVVMEEWKRTPGLLILSGETWFQHRRLITPAFHYDVLKAYIKLISDSTNVMLDKWETPCKEKRSLELFEHVSLMALDSIMKCAFSYKSNYKVHQDNPYIRAVYDLSYLVHRRMRSIVYRSSLLFHLSPDGFRFRKACRIAHQHTDKVIAQRKKLLKNEEEMEKVKQKRHPDFLDILLCAKDEKGRGLSDEDLRAEVDTFMFEGHDTTMSGISWILYCLAKHPEHQKRCREEIQELLGKRDSMEWEDLNKIPYTTMCIKEGLRLYPPVPIVSRELSKPITFYDGRSLPAGTITTLNMYCIHRNSSVWKEPEVFDPLRFSPENSNRHSHAHVPFAAGPRNCIGQNFAINEMKVAVALTVNRFELSPDLANPPLPLSQLILRSKNGIHVYLKKAS
uniref:Tc1-like transposase DDE domain-containing protein n=1 Tax=Leptobrachium leishanense TaxID=445787 RepID=A0A8C5QX98_9ANUR